MLTTLAAGRVFDFSHVVGRGAGSGMGFSMAVALALGEGDTVYVVNRGWEQIKNVPWNRTQVGTRVGKFTIGPVPGDEGGRVPISPARRWPWEMIWPAGIALDSQENVYVTDEWLNRVSIFDKDGNFLRDGAQLGAMTGNLMAPRGLPSTRRMSCISWTAATIGCRSSPRMASSCPMGQPWQRPGAVQRPPGA